MNYQLIRLLLLVKHYYVYPRLFISIIYDTQVMELSVKLSLAL